MPANVRRVAAGHSDAARLGAQWVPIVATPPPSRTNATPDVDILFVGTLRYAPNVAALRRLGRLWPEVLRRRPDTTAAIAGSAPTGEVVRLCAEHGWDLQADFADVEEVYTRGRIAVAPLDHTAGIQIKVLDAALLGVAQVVSPAALEGLAPGFPVAVAATDEEFVATAVAMLDDDRGRRQSADVAAAYVREHYTAGAWAPTVASLVGLPTCEPAEVGTTL
jgi:hypothetical protein